MPYQENTKIPALSKAVLKDMLDTLIDEPVAINLKAGNFYMLEIVGQLKYLDVFGEDIYSVAFLGDRPYELVDFNLQLDQVSNIIIPDNLIGGDVEKGKIILKTLDVNGAY